MKTRMLSMILAGILPHLSIQSVSCQTDPPDSVFIREKYIKHEYRISMRDGVKLFTRVYIPRDTSELHPILLVRTPYSVAPYGEENYPMAIPNLSRRYIHLNYILVTQDVRGRFMSEGTFVNVRPYIPAKTDTTDIDESSDAYDTIEWLVRNIPNNNGKVGVKGISYPGYYATMASIDAHPAVRATSPQAPVSEWMGRDDWFHNGAFMLSHAFDFYAERGWPRPEPTTNSNRHVDHGTPDGYAFFMELGPLSNANTKYLHDSVAFWNDLMQHGTWDDFWADRSVIPHLDSIRPATMVVGGWFDTENLSGALRTYAEIERRNPGNQNRLVMGPWAHGMWSANDLDSIGSIRLGSNLSEYFAGQIEVPFFEYHLRGNGEKEFPEATVYLTGANEWKMLDSWPPKNLESVDFYFHANGKLSSDPPADSGPGEYDEYVCDPDRPVPYTAAITQWYNDGFMVEDQRFASRRPDVVWYQTEPLRDDLTVAGPIRVRLVGSTSGTDCDWIVKLIDVFPDTLGSTDPDPRLKTLGGYQMLVRGDVLRGKFRNSLAKPEPIPSNEPTKFEYTLDDVFHRFKKGHRLMVQVQSTWFPMIDRNPGRFLDIYRAKESDFQKTAQRVYHATDRASYITVNVVAP